MRNRNNEEFEYDKGHEHATALTRIEPDAHPNIPAELPGVELEIEQVTDAMDTTDPDTDPLAAVSAIENAEFDIPDVTLQDSQAGGASEPQQIQEQNVEYGIIIEHDETLLEYDGPLVESDKNPFEALDDSDDKEDAEDIATGNETNGTQIRRQPIEYSPDFTSQRYDDTSDQIHIQVECNKNQTPQGQKMQQV